MWKTKKNNMKIISTLALMIAMVSAYGQDTLSGFPMKGSYIYYQFDESTANKKYCIKHYSNQYENGQMNTSASEFAQNVQKKAQNLDKLKLNLFSTTGVSKTTVTFLIYSSQVNSDSCVGEVSMPLALQLTIPVQNQLFEDVVIFALCTSGKFKISGQMITATVKVKFKDKNNYSLIFTNFKIVYMGMKGLNTMIKEELSLEDIYNEIQKNGSQKDKMYTKGKNTMKEIDSFVKACAKIYQDELKRIYEIDEL